MPEAPVDEDGDPILSEHNVNLSADSRDGPYVDSKSIASTVKF